MIQLLSTANYENAERTSVKVFCGPCVTASTTFVNVIFVSSKYILLRRTVTKARSHKLPRTLQYHNCVIAIETDFFQTFKAVRLVKRVQLGI
jgi:hypothetical protein